MSKKKKKSWKERQRERQIKQQRAQEAYQTRKERDADKKPRQWPKGKILGAVCLLVIIFGAYGMWQYTKPSSTSEEPPEGEVIYIRADGTVDPSNAAISNVGNIYYTFTADIHGTIAIERDNIVVDGANYILRGIGGSYCIGIDVNGKSNVTIKNTKIKDFAYGVYLYSASHSIVSQNDLTNNNHGIYLQYASNNVIRGNDLTTNNCSIYLEYSSNNILRENSITDNIVMGVYLYYSANNIVSQNDLANNYCGVNLEYSSNNILRENSITDNRYGIVASEASYNSNYHNKFTNSVQVYNNVSTNVWDDGFPSGGNYWKDYNGTDWYRGIYQNETGSDGIGDTAYNVDTSDADKYPLMGIFHSFNVTLEHSVQAICNSTISGFQFNGTTISFKVTGKDGTTGFCRICIPMALMNGDYKVFVDGTKVPHTLLPVSNGTYSYIYFTYSHSTHEIIIAS